MESTLPAKNEFLNTRPLALVSQQALHYVTTLDGGQRFANLLDTEFVCDELGRLELALTNPLRQRLLGLALAPAGRPLVDV